MPRKYDKIYPDIEPEDKVLTSSILKDDVKLVPKATGITLNQKQVDAILVSLDKIGNLTKACTRNCTKANLSKIMGLTKELIEIFE